MALEQRKKDLENQITALQGKVQALEGEIAKADAWLREPDARAEQLKRSREMVRPAIERQKSLKQKELKSALALLSGLRHSLKGPENK